MSTRLDNAVTLMGWYRNDKDVRVMVDHTLAARDLPSLGHLAEEQPETFDELFELVEDMYDQLPPDDDPAFTR